MGGQIKCPETLDGRHEWIRYTEAKGWYCRACHAEPQDVGFHSAFGIAEPSEIIEGRES